MKSKPLTAVFCLLLAACTVIAQPSENQFSRSQKESKVMTDKQAQSKFTPKQIIDNVLHLLTTSESPDDFTQDRLVKLFGSPTSTKQDGSYVFDGNVSSQWWYSFSKSITPPAILFTFGHSDHMDDKNNDMEEVCTISLDNFVEKLKKTGFSSPNRIPLRGYYMTKVKLHVLIKPGYSEKLQESYIEHLRIY